MGVTHILFASHHLFPHSKKVYTFSPPTKKVQALKKLGPGDPDMPNDYRGNGEPHEGARDQGAPDVPASAAPSDYQSTLLKIIESTTQDPRQHRRLIYELARMNLKKELWQKNRSFTPAEIR